MSLCNLQTTKRINENRNVFYRTFVIDFASCDGWKKISCYNWSKSSDIRLDVICVSSVGFSMDVFGDCCLFCCYSFFVVMVIGEKGYTPVTVEENKSIPLSFL